MDSTTLELIAALADRIEELESRISNQDRLIERIRRQMIPTADELKHQFSDREERGLPPYLSPEESYIAIWGPKQFEKIWKQSAEPFMKNIKKGDHWD